MYLKEMCVYPFITTTLVVYQSITTDSNFGTHSGTFARDYESRVFGVRLGTRFSCIVFLTQMPSSPHRLEMPIETLPSPVLGQRTKPVSQKLAPQA